MEQLGHLRVPASRLCAPAVPCRWRRWLREQLVHFRVPASRLRAPALPCRVGASSSEQSGQLRVLASRLCAPTLPCRGRRWLISAGGPPPGARIKAVCTCTALSLSAPAHESGWFSGCPHQGCVRLHCLAVSAPAHQSSRANSGCLSRLCAPALPCRGWRRLEFGPPLGARIKAVCTCTALLCRRQFAEQSVYFRVPACGPHGGGLYNYT